MRLGKLAVPRRGPLPLVMRDPKLFAQVLSVFEVFNGNFTVLEVRLMDSKALFICTGALYIGKPDRGL